MRKIIFASFFIASVAVCFAQLGPPYGGTGLENPTPNKLMLTDDEDPFRLIDLSGDVTMDPNGVVAIGSDKVLNSMFRNSAALSVIGRGLNSAGDPNDISAIAASDAVLRESGSALGFGTIATAGITDNAVTNPKLADMAAATIKCRPNGVGTGDPNDCTASEVNAIISVGGGPSSAAGWTDDGSTVRLTTATDLVSIGAATGAARLDQRLSIVGTANYGGGAFSTFSAANADHSTVFDFNRSRSSTIGSHTIVQSGDTLGYLAWRGSSGSAFVDAAAIESHVDGTPGSGSDMPGRLEFYTTLDGSASLAERMRITNAGYVLIGTTSPSANGKLSVGGGGLGINMAGAAVDAGLHINTSSSAPWTIPARVMQFTNISNSGSSYILNGATTAGGVTNYTSFGTYLDGSFRVNPGVDTISGTGFVMDTSSKVGVGVVPTQMLDVQKDQNAATLARVLNNTSGTAAQAQVQVNSNAGSIGLGMYSTTTTAYGAVSSASGFIYSAVAAGIVIMSDNAAGIIKFATGGNTERMRLDASGNLGIGAAPLVKFHVNVGTNQNFWVRTSSSVTTLEAGNDAGTSNVPLKLESSATYFSLLGVEKMRLDPNGYLGIGTTAPGNPLTVNKAGAAASGTWVNVAGFQDATPNKGVMLGYDTASQTAVIASSTSSSASNLAFWTYNGSAWGERARFLSDTGFGINTTTPLARLDVQQGSPGTMPSVGGTVGGLFRFAAGAGGGGSVDLATDPNGIGCFRIGDTAALGQERICGHNNGDSLSLWTGSAQQMTILSDGKTGIGQTTPLTQLHAKGAGVVTGDSSAQLTLEATEAYSTSPKSGLRFSVQTAATGTITPIAGIQGAKIDPNDNVSNGALQFLVKNNATLLLERMRLTHQGRLGIGTTNPLTTLHVEGSATINDGTAAAGYVLTALDPNGTASWSPSPAVKQAQRVFRSALPNLLANVTLAADTAYFVYLGQVGGAAITPKYVEFYVGAGGTGVQTAEVGLFSSSSPPNKGSLTLTKLVATGTVDDLTTSGIKRNTSAFATSVPAGTYLWAGIRCNLLLTQPAIVGLGYDFNEGMVLSTGTSGAITGAGPWTGAIITEAGVADAPDLRVTMD